MNCAVLGIDGVRLVKFGRWTRFPNRDVFPIFGPVLIAQDLEARCGCPILRALCEGWEVQGHTPSLDICRLTFNDSLITNGKHHMIASVCVGPSVMAVL